MTEPVFVLDTNCLISAGLLFRSINQRAYEKAFRLGRVIYSSNTLNEYETIFRKSKFDKYLSLTDRENLITLFKKDAHLVIPTQQIQACRDPKDNKFLELAVAGNASCIITGDKDLIVLHPFKNIAILSAADFLEQF